MNIQDEINNLKQNVNEIEKQKAKLDFYNSLIQAVKYAGGACENITEEITLKELADIFAINKVRFTYIGESKRNMNDSLVYKKSSTLM